MKQMMAYIIKHNLIRDGDKIVIAFSGGPDSVYLLLGLLKLREKMDLSLAAVHINHKLQQIAEEHAAFVREFCREHAVDLYYFEKDIEKYAKQNRLSIEEAGRAFRYEKFYEVKEMLGYDRIAVAHHQNDRAETVLYRMARGTGWKGLAGIRPVQGMIIRPLLGLSKEQILQELGQMGQRYNEDPSNSDTMYARNRIRHNVVPELQMVNDQAVRHICDLAEQLDEIGVYLQQEISLHYAQCVEETADGWSVRLSELEKYPEFMQREILKMTAGKAAGQEKDLTRKHIQDLQRLGKMQTGKRIDLPYGIRAWKRYDRLVLQKEQLTVNQVISIHGEGRYEIPFAKGILEVRIFQKNQEISEKIYTKTFDYDKMKHDMAVRTYQEGDYFIMNREGQHKKLNRYFIDRKIPADQRKKIPLVADGSHIVWIIGGRISEAYKVTDDTTTIVQLSWELMEEKEWKAR
ncbi:MAG TPA: tRNA lysidine(34) synthetase TilS [Candidatus Fimousia stercorigallinarum]|nr:tRNA lysidine(34) synthetase TilS [Candidatus Fimousia stercorigallinarum]